MIRSLRFRLFLGVTAASVLVLGVLSVAVDQAVHRTLQAEFDRALLEKARALASMVEQQDGKIHFDYQRTQFPEFEPGPRASYFEIFLDGHSSWLAASLPNGHLPQANGGQSSIAFTLPDGRTGRLLSLAFLPFIESDEHEKDIRPQAIGLVVVAQDSLDLDRTLTRLRLLTLLLCGAATLLSGAALVAVTGRAVRPVSALAARIESLDESDLSTVLDASVFPTELKPVVDHLNGMLRRLGEAFNRERAFAADVAHELRTPLAGLLATLEVSRSRPRDTAAYEGSIDKCLIMLTGMHSLIENLLLMARADSGQLTLRQTPVDLAPLAQECWQTLTEKAQARGLEFSFKAEAVGPVEADRQLLRIVIDNLLNNAISYAAQGTRVLVRLFQVGPRIALEARNTGHALTAADIPQIFQRFWRKDAARSDTGSHAGLGLSICQRLLSLQGGNIAARVEGDDFVVTIDMPTNARSA